MGQYTYVYHSTLRYFSILFDPGENGGGFSHDVESREGISHKLGGSNKGIYEPLHKNNNEISNQLGEIQEAEHVLLMGYDTVGAMGRMDYALKSKAGKEGLRTKITETQSSIALCELQKQNAVTTMAERIFNTTEAKNGVKIAEEKKAEFILGLTAAMKVEGISETQRYTIVGRYVQGFLTPNTDNQKSIEPNKETSYGDSSDLLSVGTLEKKENLEKMPEQIGREALASSEGDRSGSTFEEQVRLVQESESTISSLSSELTTHYRDLHEWTHTKGEESLPVVRGNEVSGKENLSESSHGDILTTSLVLGNLDRMPKNTSIVLPDWNSAEGGDDSVILKKYGEVYSLNFSSGECYIIDSPPNEREREIKFIRTMRSTPVMRRLIGMGDDYFTMFSRLIGIPAPYQSPEKTRDFMNQAMTTIGKLVGEAVPRDFSIGKPVDAGIYSYMDPKKIQIWRATLKEKGLMDENHHLRPFAFFDALRAM